MGSFPTPPPFRFQTDTEPTEWLDALLLPLTPHPPPVGAIVPSGFEAYARLLHPALRSFGSPGENVPLRWSEIAAARGKTMHPEVGLHSLIDTWDEFDYHHWTAMSTGGGTWSPPSEQLGETETLALVVSLRPYTTTFGDAWFMLWDGYANRDGSVKDLPRGTIHRHPEPQNVPAELVGRTLAYRQYLVFRGPLEALSIWFDWRGRGPNYLWPDDRGWIIATEIDGFSTYVGAPTEAIDRILASPSFEAFPSVLTHRFDGIGDPINGVPQ